MKPSTIKPLILALFTLPFLSSCEKVRDIKKREFKAKTSTWYRIAPTQTPTPVVIDNTTYTTFANVPGGGYGNATHMGNVKTYFNQLAFTASELPIPAGSLVAPVVDVINYPVLGAPLPLIQTGDFAGLSSINSKLHIPQSVHGKTVSSIFYNDKGDAVFVSNSSVSTITPVSSNRNNFGGKALIVGGRGKFSTAYGEVDFTGWFNPNNPNEAEYGVEGWICY